MRDLWTMLMLRKCSWYQFYHHYYHYNCYHHYNCIINIIIKECYNKKRIIYGDLHLDTLNSMCNLARSYMHLNKLEDAYALTNECLTKQKATLPESHPHVLLSKMQLDMIKAKMMNM